MPSDVVTLWRIGSWKENVLQKIVKMVVSSVFSLGFEGCLIVIFLGICLVRRFGHYLVFLMLVMSWLKWKLDTGLHWVASMKWLFEGFMSWLSRWNLILWSRMFPEKTASKLPHVFVWTDFLLSVFPSVFSICCVKLLLWKKMLENVMEKERYHNIDIYSP